MLSPYQSLEAHGRLVVVHELRIRNNSQLRGLAHQLPHSGLRMIERYTLCQ